MVVVWEGKNDIWKYCKFESDISNLLYSMHTGIVPQFSVAFHDVQITL